MGDRTRRRASPAGRAAVRAPAGRRAASGRNPLIPRRARLTHRCATRTLAVIDLDSLPWPYRDDIDYLAHDLPTASVLGSRGCPWDCSFCSIRPFYEAQEGPLRR